MLAFTVATKHAPRGEGSVAAYVGLRIDAVEERVAALRKEADGGYRSRTTAAMVGSLMPGRSPQWWVDANHAEALASEIATAVEDYGVPYLAALEADADLLLDGIRGSAAWMQSTGRTRFVVALEHLGRHDEAVAAASAWRDELHGRDDLAAEDGHQALDALDAWLGSVT